MKTFELEGSSRAACGKKKSNDERKNDLIPAVLYGGKEENINFTIQERSIKNLIYTPEVYIVDLNIDGKVYKSILKDAQFHPVNDKILHLDFLRVFEDKPVVIEIPVRIEGLAEGVKAGGKLSTDMRKLKVRGLHSDLPEYLTVNVENLGLGKSIQVGSLQYDKLEILNPKEVVVCRVQLTRAARGAALAAKAEKK